MKYLSENYLLCLFLLTSYFLSKRKNHQFLALNSQAYSYEYGFFIGYYGLIWAILLIVKGVFHLYDFIFPGLEISTALNFMPHKSQLREIYGYVIPPFFLISIFLGALILAQLYIYKRQKIGWVLLFIFWMTLPFLLYHFGSDYKFSPSTMGLPTVYGFLYLILLLCSFGYVYRRWSEFGNKF